MKNITIGIPKTMLYYRFEHIWKAFFKILNVNVITSQETNRAVVERGMALCVDEMCLSGKILIGHIDSLVGRCDKVLLPRVSNFGFKRNMCTRFESLPDIAKNVFRKTGQDFLTYDYDVNMKKEEQDAFIEMGMSLGFDKKTAKNAYKRAKKYEARKWAELVEENEKLYKSDGMKILVVAHNYVIEDPYLGKPVMDGLRDLGAIPIRADVVDRKHAIKKALDVSPTLKWQYNLELCGAVAMHHEDVDGVIFLSAFPCGPDSMVNEIIMRRIKGVPMINLTLDGQSGTAGLETRLESFIDIIHFKEGTL